MRIRNIAVLKKVGNRERSFDENPNKDLLQNEKYKEKIPS